MLLGLGPRHQSKCSYSDFPVHDQSSATQAQEHRLRAIPRVLIVAAEDSLREANFGNQRVTRRKAGVCKQFEGSYRPPRSPGALAHKFVPEHPSTLIFLLP